jgi:hypothetical protein
MLSTDPYVRVNDSPPARLTKTPVVFDVPDGFFTVDVGNWATSHESPPGRWSNPVSHYEGSTDARQRADLTYHPAFISSYMHRGRLRRVT